MSGGSIDGADFLDTVAVLDAVDGAVDHVTLGAESKESFLSQAPETG